ncbi:protocadherin Fat 2 [Monodelphis domestica]|uniref:protocadherin Fat 2 n=1 Tax=Monodelphis domestica TaxID=13616 RepID=UPI0024E1B14B|nr:protocadherin Fat 2 [Monodelphis domestica]XP_056667468.1 protocadherin Fat 2 [Monodelphis domestica]
MMAIIELGFALLLLCCLSFQRLQEGPSPSSLHFTHPLYNATIFENSAPKTYVESLGKMGVYLAEPQLVVRYRIISGDLAGVFKTEEYVVGNFCFLRIRTKSGNTAILNREVRDSYTLVIQATEQTLGYEASTHVLIHILDQNDLKPLFSPPSYKVAITEDTPLKSAICMVSATDADLGQNADFYYAFNARSELFTVHPTSGVVTVTRKLNATWKGRHELQVLAVDRMRKISEGNGFGNLASLVIQVDPSPKKPPAISSVVMTSQDDAGDNAHATLLVDANGSEAGVETVNIVDGDPGKHFKVIRSYVGSNKFTLVSIKDIDWLEYRHGFNLSLQAKGSGKPPLYSQIRGIHLPPSKLTSARFEKAIYRVQLSEVSPPGSRVVMVKVTPTFPSLQYILKPTSESSGFKINSRTGLITTTRLMDFHDRARYQLHIGTTLGQASTTVVIDIIDCNNHAPVFSQSSYHGTFDENLPPGTSILTVTATDQDHGENGFVTYSITSPRAVPFSIDPYLGVISITKLMDYELMQRLYTFRVWASDWGSPFHRESEVSISLMLNNLNDNQPMFENANCSGTIPWDLRVGETVVTLSAIDMDELLNLRYKIVSGNELEYFDLNHFSGVVSLKRSFKGLPPGQRYFLEITASDGDNYALPTSLNVTVVASGSPVHVQCEETGVLKHLTETIIHSVGSQIQEPSSEEFTFLSTYHINHYSPQFEDHFPQSIDILEGVPVNTTLAYLAASDLDTGFNGKLVYVLAGGNEESRFNVELETGLLKVAAPLDHETTSFYILNVTVYDLGTPQKSTWKHLAVNVGDENDNTPRFPPGGYQVEIREDIEVGTTIAQMKAEDADSDDNGRVCYTLLSPTDKFSVHALTGEVVVTGSLDRESQPQYVLKVEARDQAKVGHQLFSITNLVVTLSDVNDNTPQCIPELSQVKVPEDLPLGTVLTFLEAFDPDLGPGGEVKYTLVDNAQGTFGLDPLTGALSLERELDFEKRTWYNLSLWASDGGKPMARGASCHVQVTVLDVNENLHPPRFASFVYQGQVEENSLPGTLVMSVTAQDADFGQDGVIQYFLRDGTDLDTFSIDRDTGMIQTMMPLDREFSPHYWLTVLAVDQGSVPLSSVTEVYIEVMDTNDNPPQMSRPVYYPSVKEDAPMNTSVLQLDAWDPDPVSQGKLTFHITSGNNLGFFVINSLTGLLSTARQLDRENKAEHILEVAVQDNGKPSLQSTSRVVVRVLDVNDNSPTFSHKRFKIRLPERQDSSVPRPVYRLVASDRDEGPNGKVSYSIEENYEEAFTIDAETGLVSASVNFPAGEYNILTIQAVDSGQPPRSSSVRLHIEWIPRPNPSGKLWVFDEPHYNFDAVETDPVNHMVGMVSVEDPPGLLWFNISGGDENMDFDIEMTTGSMVIARQLDSRRKANYNLTVEATDGSRTITTQVFIQLIIINQHRPQFLEAQYEVKVPQGTPPGLELLRVQATDQDKGKNLVYTIQGSLDARSTKLFQLDPNSGSLVTVGKLDMDSGLSRHILTVMVRDQEIPIKRNFVWVTIQIEDRNLHSPSFIQLHYETTTSTIAALGTELLQVRALDADRGFNGQVQYSLQAGNSESLFTIDPHLGIITVAQKLDLMQQDQYMLTVRAEDQGSPPLHDVATVTIHIHPSDYSAPIFSMAEYFAEIPESVAIGSPLLLVSALSTSEVTYEMREGNKDGVFSINSYSGLISTQKNLDHEKVSSYQLKVRGSNMAGAFADVMVLVYIIDENDNAPVFINSSFVGQISEAAPIHSMILGEYHHPLVVRATDADTDANALLVYEILEREALKFFKIDPSMGTLTTVMEMDYEHIPSFSFSIHVHDQGSPILFASKPARVTIHVKDVNDSPPVFSEDAYEVMVLLPIHPGMELLQVQATDADSVVTYSIIAGNADDAVFIHPLTGLISVVDVALLGHSRDFTVKAFDGLHYDTSVVKINLTEALVTTLKFDQDVYTVTVKENSWDTQALIIMGVQGSQLNDTLSYSVLNGTDMFQMIQSVGVLQTKGVAFDREQQDAYVVAVEVRDDRHPPRVAQAAVKISIEDVNDNPPEFRHLPYYTAIQDGTEPGDVLFQVSAIDLDIGANGAITYAFAEDYMYFWIDPYLGDISLKKPFDYRALNKYTLRVIAQDGGNPSLKVEENVLVTVRNKSNPLFQSLHYKVRVPENIALYTPILHTQARSPEGLRLIYNIMEEESLTLFTADFKTGVLTVTGPLDYESQTKHIFTVRATDTALGSFSEATVEVQVEDINDNPPVFSQLVYSALVSEGLPPQTPVIQLLASDQDSGRNKDVSYWILEDDSEDSSFFQIDESSGEMSTTQELDYETQQQFYVKVRAVDNGVPPLSAETLVIVNVSDVNDNPPAFRQPQYEANVSELATCGQLVIKVQALDPDSGDTTRLEYLILSGNEDRHFTINSTSGIISMFNFCRKHLDSAYLLRVAASDGVFRTAVPVYINTTNANKYSPEFRQHIYEVELAENAEIGTKVIELLAVDPDDGPYGTIDYTIINKLASEKFSINSRGQIATLQKLDRENPTEKLMPIKVMARDGGGRVAFCSVKTILTDENDNPPQFKASEYTVSVQSNVSKGSPVIQVLAYDADEGANADVTYSVDSVEDLADEVIEVNSATGVVKVKESLVGLENQAFNFKIKAQDGGPPHWDSLIPVRLQVVPNEVTLPKFSEPSYTFSVSEDLPEGSEVGLVKAVAEDPIIYSLVKGTTPESNKDGVFSLDQETGALTVKKAIDYETTKWYQIDVMANCSHQETGLISLVSVNIQVKDVNDNKPVFEADPYKAFLTENMPVGTTVIQVTANDQDTGVNGEVTYSLALEQGNAAAELFAINSENGWITTLRELDCEVQEMYSFYVVASDHGRTIQLSSKALVEVTITDENDNAPQFASEVYRGSVIENGEPGEHVATLRTLDADISEQNRQVTCYITEGDPLGQFGISQTGDEWKITTKKTLDREHIAKYLLKVTASDGKFQASTPVEVFVLDINDNSPQCTKILYSSKVPEDVLPGHFILQVTATDLDTGVNALVTYSLHGPGADEFKLDPYTGELTTLMLLDREEKDVYYLVAKATDGGGRSCQADVTIRVEDVNDNAPRFFPSHCSVAVFDNTTVKTPVAVVFARDPDEGINAQVSYSLVGSADGHFSIEATTGVVRLEKPLQAMQQEVLELIVRASDQGTPTPLSTLGTITVSVVDLADYLPVFLNTEHNVQVPEDAQPGTEVLRLSPLTREGAEKMGYQIVSGNEREKFRLDYHTGILYVNGSLDFETSQEYYLSIECSRKGSPSLNDGTMVVVNVTDVNDHPPKFPQDVYSVEVKEDVAVGETILTVSAVDGDGPLNSAITYSLVAGDQLGHFTIHPKKGELQIAKHLDWEETSSYSLTLRATDSGQPVLYQDAVVNVEVADVNDNPPRFFQLNYSIVVQENAPLGSRVLELVLSDRDSTKNGPPYSFHITEGNDGSAFRVTDDGWLVTAAVLNRKFKEQYLLQIQVTDSGVPPLSSSAFVNAQVTEQSQYPPSALPLEIFITTGEQIFQGGVVGKIHATDQDPRDTLTYRLMEKKPIRSHFSVGIADGKIIANEGLPHGHYNLNINVSDGTFVALAGVHVHVWHAAPEAQARAVLLQFRHLSPEEFVGDHWRNLQRFLGSALGFERQHIYPVSLQPAEEMVGIDILLAFEEALGSFHEPRSLSDSIARLAREIEHSVGIHMTKVAPVALCQGPGCQEHICTETLQLDSGAMSTYSTARISILTPKYSLRVNCSCNDTAARFSSQSSVQYQRPFARDWHIRFQLKTQQPDASLLFLNWSTVAFLELTDGMPHLEYHCPGGFQGNLSSMYFVSDQEWHLVLLVVTGASIRLLIDGKGNASTVLPEHCWSPQFGGDLFLGGRIRPHLLQQTSRAFRGCVNDITVNGEELELLSNKQKKGAGFLKAKALTQCCPQSSVCMQNPCLNGGQCSETYRGGYKCLCPASFSGDHCELGRGSCESRPCLNEGKCLLKPGGAFCSCVYPYTGERCEEMAECPNGPCETTTQTTAHQERGYGQQEIKVIAVGVACAVLIIIVFMVLCYYCHPDKTHRPVAKDDPDLFAKSVGVDTQTMPIELNPLDTGSHNNLDCAGPEAHKASVAPEFLTFGPGPGQRQRSMIVCSVAPNLPPAAPPSNSDNESIIKSTWAGEEMVYPAEATFWAPSYAPAELQEYSRYEVMQGPMPASPHRGPPPPADPEPPALYGGFPFPLESANKRAPIPPRYSNQNLEDFLPLQPPSPDPRERPHSPCPNEYTAISYYPSHLLQPGGPLYPTEGAYKRVSVRLSVAQPSYADCEVVPCPPGRPLHYEGSDMVESDYGSCEEVMF